MTTDHPIVKGPSAEAYWRSQIAREVYLKAEEISRIKVGGIRMGESSAQLIRAIGDLIGRMPEQTGSHADDVDAPGPVLTEEPGHEVTAAVDRDGERWERTSGGAWQYTGDGPAHIPHTWYALELHHGPIRSAS